MVRLASSVATVGGATLVSRVLGFIRDLTIARLFGADAATDAFFVAFKIPNLARRLFAEGAFAMALVPTLQTQRQRGKAALASFIADLTGTLGLGVSLITLLGILGAPALILAFAPGFGAAPDQFALSVSLLRLTLPYLALISLAALAASILNTQERFAVPAITPALLNLAMIACALWLAPCVETPIMALAWGVLLGGLLQLAVQLPPLAQLGLMPRPRFAPGATEVIQVFRRMGPSILGSSVGQISLLLDTVLASLLATGSISWLYYADRLMELPLGLVGAALGTVVLPRLTRHHNECAHQLFADTLDWALRLGLVLGLPAAIGLAVLAGPLVATLFHSSSFGAEDARMAAWGLIAYAFGIPPFILIRVLVSAYYARQEVRTPAQIALIVLGLGLILHLILMAWIGHVGLALATTLTALLDAALLLHHLLRAGIYRPSAAFKRLMLQTLAAGLCMGLALGWGVGSLEDWLAEPGISRWLGLTGWILAGLLLYGGILALSGVRPRALWF
ncbi:murein biosynthesis integral membrane protein MurJ [Caldichromatium japonicum]|uniref:Probable lipid II flippase MurJ n=1 Tax=Caldichromatium japonicum TaxID=2699430 RepID=A0A6G7VCX9_9GAMM|nr:murein biosynthesis integral membrane protein MurJ [Caldichromatium japonicum]QIK37909.1 murein biosynthesis integral membrane protein MurJ [Caldichromatium japonicum]